MFYFSKPVFLSMMNKGTMGHYSGGMGDQRGSGDGVVGKGMGNHRGSSSVVGKGMGYSSGMVSNWVSHNWGMMSNWVGNKWGMMGHWVGNWVSNWVADKRGMLQQGLVRAGDTFVLNISVVLLVLINKIINNLGPTVRQLNPVLSLHNWSLSGLSSGVVVGVTIGIIIIHLESKGVILGGLFMVGFRMVGGGMMGYYRGVVHKRGGMVHKWGGVVDKRGSGVMHKGSRGVVQQRSSSMVYHGGVMHQMGGGKGADVSRDKETGGEERKEEPLHG